jgi:acetyl esterase/lipase
MTMPRRNLLAALATLAMAGCSRAAFFAVNLPAAFGAHKRHADIAYGDGPRQRLDVYTPAAPRGGAAVRPRALVVFWHGGRWEFGDKNDYRFVGAALAEAGYVAVLPNYRHYPEVKLAGFMADAARAAAWAQAHAGDYDADAARVYWMGHSSGAHIAALLALDVRYFAPGPPPAIAGLIGLSGPYDFLPLQEADLQDMFGPPQRYLESQPIHFAHAGAPPMLLIHGLKDDTVWPKNTRNLATALGALGVPVTLRLYEHAKHPDTIAALSPPVRGRAPTLSDILAFIGPP